MTLAIGTGDAAVIVSDTRRGATTATGETFEDSPGRLLAVPGGWATATGEVLLSDLALRALQAEGVNDAGRVRETVRGVYARYAGKIRTAFPLNGEGLDKTAVAVLLDGPRGLQALGVRASDGAVFGSPGELVATFPPGFSEEEKDAILDGVERDLSGGVDPTDVVRAFAAALAGVAARTDSVSPLVHVGIMLRRDGQVERHFIRSDARLLAKSSGELIGALVEPPPPPPLCGLTESPYAGMHARAGTVPGGWPGFPVPIATAAVTDAIRARHIASHSMEVAKYIESSGYVAGSTGWKIQGDGNAEFNNVTVRGTVYASAGEFGGTVTASEFTADTANFKRVVGFDAVNVLTDAGIHWTGGLNISYITSDGNNIYVRPAGSMHLSGRQVEYSTPDANGYRTLRVYWP